MALHNINPTQTAAWQKIQLHFETMKNVQMKELFENDKLRAENMHIEYQGFLLDYSKNIITNETLNLFLELADEVNLKDAISKYFGGDLINLTEKRSVLHTALRAPESASIFAGDLNIIPEIYAVKNKIKNFSNDVISGKRKGYSGKEFTDIVNVGIGGSDLGPAMAVEALQFYKNHLNVHFISNIDGDHIAEVLKKLNPETTLFVIVSKTFSTQETITNATTIKKWFLESAKEADVAKHFVAVSTNIQKAAEFGIDTALVFPMWDWVGGRFSLWSAVGLSISLAVGFDHFDALLKGANQMDEHFKNKPFGQNMPVVLAFLSIWYNNFFGAESEAIIPYTQYLDKFVPYLQQGIMESNGKSIARDGNQVNYQTGTIIWGEPGSNSQHAFFQLIHQGTKLIPTDFIGFKESLHGNQEHHDKLMSNFFAQTETLLIGKTAPQVSLDFEKENSTAEDINFLAPFKLFAGNKPTNTLLIDKLTPNSLGSLIALYEHKIFVQGIIWNIFSYDQWGVELGKQSANTILNEIANKKVGLHDGSTSFLLKKYLE